MLAHCYESRGMNELRLKNEMVGQNFQNCTFDGVHLCGAGGLQNVTEVDAIFQNHNMKSEEWTH